MMPREVKEEFAFAVEEHLVMYLEIRGVVRCQSI
jgi:hypothetical protein